MTHTDIGGGSSDRGDFWALPVEILVFASPTGYMLTSPGFPLWNRGVSYIKIPLIWSVIFLQSWTSTGYVFKLNPVHL